MSIRIITLVACASLTVAGCASDKSITDPAPATALVRFINATNAGTDVAVSGLVTTANTNIAFGGATGCLTVNAAAPGLSFRTTASTTDIAGFTPAFTAGHRYWVVAISGTGGATQFVTIDQAATPSAGNAALVGLNANSGTTNYDLHVTAPSATLSTATVVNANLAFGVPSAVATATILYNTATPPVAQPQQLRFTTAGTTTVARNHGNVTFVPATSNLAIIAQGAAATPTTLRSIFNAGC
jgi:hypothetical protein